MELVIFQNTSASKREAPSPNPPPLGEGVEMPIPVSEC